MSAPLGVGHNPTVAQRRHTSLRRLGQECYHPAVLIHRMGRLLLDSREMADDVAISPDAQYVAYTRPEIDNRSRVVMRHIPSAEWAPNMLCHLRR